MKKFKATLQKMRYSLYGEEEFECVCLVDNSSKGGEFTLCGNAIPDSNIEIEGFEAVGNEFLGFCDTYYYLSMLIPKDWTIIDFGAGNNPQSYFFTEHKKYIAVNPLSPYKEENGMFCPPNCEIYRMTTGEFLKIVDYPKEKVFAICNYVPDWHRESSMELVRNNFKNCYTFYPE